MAERHLKCSWGKVNDQGRYPCIVHEGGFFLVGSMYCTKTGNPFGQAEVQARQAFQREATQLEHELGKLPGRWRLVGHDGNRWTAKGTVGMRPNVEVHADTSHGLLERVRQRVNPAAQPSQGVLW